MGVFFFLFSCFARLGSLEKKKFFYFLSFFWCVFLLLWEEALEFFLVFLVSFLCNNKNRRCDICIWSFFNVFPKCKSRRHFFFSLLICELSYYSRSWRHKKLFWSFFVCIFGWMRIRGAPKNLGVCKFFFIVTTRIRGATKNGGLSIFFLEYYNRKKWIFFFLFSLLQKVWLFFSMWM